MPNHQLYHFGVKKYLAPWNRSAAALSKHLAPPINTELGAYHALENSCL